MPIRSERLTGLHSVLNDDAIDKIQAEVGRVRQTRQVTEPPRYLYSKIVPRTGPPPNLAHVPPHILWAASRYNTLLQTFANLISTAARAPTATVRLKDAAQPNPPIEVDFAEAIPMASANELRFLASEILHRLRSAADHLVYNVAWIDSGKEQPRTQFPVAKTKAEFKKVSRGMLRGVSELHQSWFEEVQPYNGVAWTAAMAGWSNKDKHRFLLEIAPTLSFRMDLHAAVVIGTSGKARLPVDQLEMHLLLREHETEGYERLDETLSQIMEGLVSFVNRFLQEAEIPEIQLAVEPGQDERA